jgi:hypothetical protein
MDDAADRDPERKQPGPADARHGQGCGRLHNTMSGKSSVISNLTVYIGVIFEYCR